MSFLSHDHFTEPDVTRRASEGLRHICRDLSSAPPPPLLLVLWLCFTTSAQPLPLSSVDFWRTPHAASLGCRSSLCLGDGAALPTNTFHARICCVHSGSHAGPGPATCVVAINNRNHVIPEDDPGTGAGDGLVQHAMQDHDDESQRFWQENPLTSCCEKPSLSVARFAAKLITG